MFFNLIFYFKMELKQENNFSIIGPARDKKSWFVKQCLIKTE